jgi:hypothetical protein
MRITITTCSLWSSGALVARPTVTLCTSLLHVVSFLVRAEVDLIQSARLALQGASDPLRKSATMGRSPCTAPAAITGRHLFRIATAEFLLTMTPPAHTIFMAGGSMTMYATAIFAGTAIGVARIRVLQMLYGTRSSRLITSTIPMVRKSWLMNIPLLRLPSVHKRARDQTIALASIGPYLDKQRNGGDGS